MSRSFIASAASKQETLKLPVYPTPLISWDLLCSQWNHICCVIVTVNRLVFTEYIYFFLIFHVELLVILLCAKGYALVKCHYSLVLNALAAYFPSSINPHSILKFSYWFAAWRAFIASQAGDADSSKSLVSGRNSIVCFRFTIPYSVPINALFCQWKYGNS